MDSLWSLPYYSLSKHSFWCWFCPPGCPKAHWVLCLKVGFPTAEGWAGGIEQMFFWDPRPKVGSWPGYCLRVEIPSLFSLTFFYSNISTWNLHPSQAALWRWDNLRDWPSLLLFDQWHHTTAKWLSQFLIQVNFLKVKKTALPKVIITRFLNLRIFYFSE